MKCDLQMNENLNFTTSCENENYDMETWFHVAFLEPFHLLAPKVPAPQSADVWLKSENGMDHCKKPEPVLSSPRACTLPYSTLICFVISKVWVSICERPTSLRFFNFKGFRCRPWLFLFRHARHSGIGPALKSCPKKRSISAANRNKVAQELEDQNEEVQTGQRSCNFFFVCFFVLKFLSFSEFLVKNVGFGGEVSVQELLDCVSDGDGEPLDSLEDSDTHVFFF